MVGKRGSVEERFNSKVVRSETGCWLWTGCKDNHGYGQLAIRQGLKIRSHRISYELFVGEIPEGQFVLHKCDNPACVRPDHLFLGSQKDNMRDMDQKDRRKLPQARRGSENARAKFTDEEIITLRSRHASGETFSELARECGISTTNMSRILRGERYRSSGGPLATAFGQFRTAYRRPRGSEFSHSKLTEELVREIRLRFNAGESGIQLAERFGTNKTTIYRALNGATWGHVT